MRRSLWESLRRSNGSRTCWRASEPSSRRDRRAPRRPARLHRARPGRARPAVAGAGRALRGVRRGDRGPPGPTVSAPLVVGGDPSLTATALAWPDGRVITHGRAGLTNVRTPLQERGQAMMALVLELGHLIAGGAPTLALDAWSEVSWPRLVLLE